MARLIANRRRRTPSASVHMLFFISISSVAVAESSDACENECIVYMDSSARNGFVVSRYFIGFIEYQGQSLVLKSNILKYSYLTHFGT